MIEYKKEKINLNLDIIKECYETLKRNKHIVGSIDLDYYLDLDYLY